MKVTLHTGKNVKLNRGNVKANIFNQSRVKLHGQNSGSTDENFRELENNDIRALENDDLRILE